MKIIENSDFIHTQNNDTLLPSQFSSTGRVTRKKKKKRKTDHHGKPFLIYNQLLPTKAVLEDVKREFENFSIKAYLHQIAEDPEAFRERSEW